MTDTYGVKIQLETLYQDCESKIIEFSASHDTEIILFIEQIKKISNECYDVNG